MTQQLVVENDVEERAVDLQPAVVVDESQFPEPIHKKAHSRASGADHFCQRFLTDLWHHGLRNPFLAKMSEQ